MKHAVPRSRKLLLLALLLLFLLLLAALGCMVLDLERHGAQELRFVAAPARMDTEGEAAL